MKNYCISCRTECHEGVTCEEHQRLMAKQRDEKLLRDNLGLLPFKKCPKCTVLIEKYAGCNAVKCTQCTIAFCWLCDKTDPVDGEFASALNEMQRKCSSLFSTCAFLRSINTLLQ